MCSALCFLEMHVNHFARIFKFVEEKSKLAPIHKFANMQNSSEIQKCKLLHNVRNLFIQLNIVNIL